MSIFIFRRDFRVQDNLALTKLSKLDSIIPIFIFDPFQLDTSHIYFSQKSLDFMIDCIQELHSHIPLQLFMGNPTDVIKDILKNNSIQRIAFNADFSPYSKTRDTAIVSLCETNQIESIVDNLDLILDTTQDGNLPEISKVFGVYAKKDHNVQLPVKAVKNFSTHKLKSKYSISLIDALKLRKSPSDGGRKNALTKIKAFKNYNKSRDNVSIDTSRMSAYLKYGCVSIRELWHISKNPLYRRQLLWRSFYIITGATRTATNDGYGHIEKKICQH